MAGIARFPPAVLGQYHLGEPLRFGRIRFVAAAAQLRHIRTRRLFIAHCLGMTECRPVTSFARYPGMFALASKRRHRFVANHAGLLPRVTQRALTVVSERARAIVAVLAELRRHQSLSKQQEGDQGADENYRHPSQMCGVMGNLPHRWDLTSMIGASCGDSFVSWGVGQRKSRQTMQLHRIPEATCSWRNGVFDYTAVVLNCASLCAPG